MSEEFKIIYKVLKILKDSMDVEEFNSDLISFERLGISEAKWSRLMKMLFDNGYIQGLRIEHFIAESYPHIDDLDKTEITLKGLEYLEENSLMKKASNIAKGIVDIVK